jgi:hypothetical protein
MFFTCDNIPPNPKMSVKIAHKITIHSIYKPD